MKLRPCLPFAVFANEAATDRASGSQPTGGHRDLPPGDLGGTTPSGDQTGRFRRPLLRLRRLPLCWPRPRLGHQGTPSVSYSDDGAISSSPAHTISPVEQAGFEPSVPRQESRLLRLPVSPH